MPSPHFDRIRNDITGGLVSSALAIPLALGFGMFVYVVLGDQYFAHGALAGLIAAFVSGVICVLLGDRSVTVYAPRITTTFFLGLLLFSLAHSSEPGLAGAPASFTLLVLFAIMLLAGLFQALFGLLKIGTLIKFAPHPVMAGFQNMAAVLLFLVQLSNVLGHDHNVPFTQVHTELMSAKPLSILVAAITFLVMWNARKITTKVPPLLTGLAAGIAAYYALAAAGFGAALGPVIGMPSPAVTVAQPVAALTDATLLAKLLPLTGVIVFGALALAIIAAIDAMLCAKLAAQRGDSNKLLLRLGLANAVAAASGGITSGINIGATVANRTFGGHSWVAVIVNAAVLLVTIVFLLPYVTLLPRAVISAVIMVVAIQHIDPWSKQAAARLFKESGIRRRAVAVDLGIALAVSILSIAVNIVLAVFLGIAVAIALFLLRMSRSNVRRLYRCDTVRSRKARTPEEMQALERDGASILVIELQGALFFGSAERLAQIIGAETAQPTRALILDLRRVTEVDSTGVMVLAEADGDLARRGIRLTLVQRPGSETAERLAELPGARTPDVDRAIEAAEDDLLGAASQTGAPAEVPLENVALLHGFAAEQIARLRPYLTPDTWAAGSTIFQQGDPGTDLFLVTRGRASVRLISGDRNIRLATFAPGTVFGELAILDDGPRSATVTADEDLATLALSRDAFETLRAKEPDLAIQIVTALGRALSSRLRQANLTIHQLEM